MNDLINLLDAQGWQWIDNFDRLQITKKGFTYSIEKSMSLQDLTDFIASVEEVVFKNI